MEDSTPAGGEGEIEIVAGLTLTGTLTGFWRGETNSSPPFTLAAAPDVPLLSFLFRLVTVAVVDGVTSLAPPPPTDMALFLVLLSVDFLEGLEGELEGGSATAGGGGESTEKKRLLGTIVRLEREDWPGRKLSSDVLFELMVLLAGVAFCGGGSSGGGATGSTTFLLDFWEETNGCCSC